MREKWGESILVLDRDAILLDLDLWLEARIKAKSLSDPFFDANQCSEKRGDRADKFGSKNSKPGPQRKVNAVTKAADACVYCEKPHHLANCMVFKEMASVDERQEFVRNSCFQCISPGIIGRNCNATKTACGVDGCKLINYVCIVRETTTMLSVVPFTFENPDTNVSIRTYGLIDKGVELVLIKRDIANALKLNLQPAGFSLGHFDGTSDKSDSTSTIRTNLSPFDCICPRSAELSRSKKYTDL